MFFRILTLFFLLSAIPLIADDKAPDVLAEKIYSEASEFSKKGIVLFNKEDYLEAIKYLEKAKDIIRKRPTPDMWDIEAEAYLYLSNAYNRINENQKALDLADEGINLFKKEKGYERDFAYCGLLIIKARALYQLYHYKEGIDSLEMACALLPAARLPKAKPAFITQQKTDLETWKKQVSELNDPNAKPSELPPPEIGRRAFEALDKDKLETAEPYFNEMLKYDQADNALNTETLAVGYYGLGRIAFAQKDDKKASEHFDLAKKAIDKYPYRDLVLKDEIYTYCSAACGRLGQFDKAIDLMQQALVFVKEEYGEEAPQTAVKLAGVASILQKQGKLQKAIELMEQASAIIDKSQNQKAKDTIKGKLQDWKKELLEKKNIKGSPKI